MVNLSQQVELYYDNAIPLQAWADTWGSRRFKLPEFLDNRQGFRPPLLGTHFF
jgi:hypothetical protein